MPLGMIVLLAVAVLIYLGLAERVLDRMRLTDRSALIFIGAIIVGSYLPDIPLYDNLAINIGGGVIPVILAVYLLVRAGTVTEKVRAVIATAITTLLVFVTYNLLPTEPAYGFMLEPIFIVALVAGVVGYLAGRSRRSAFIAGTMGIAIYDIIARVQVAVMGGRGSIVIGGAGVFDAIIIAGLIAVGLAELVGEARERIQGGPDTDRDEELSAGLGEEFGRREEKFKEEGGEGSENS